MARTILGVIAGYLAMFVAVMVSFTLLYLVLGAERSFQPGSYRPSGLWMVASVALGFAAAVLGGRVCAAVTRSAKAGRALAVVVVVLGIVFAIPVLTSSIDPGPRTGDVPNFEAMQKAQQPKWAAILNPILGAAGVLVGSRRAGQA